MVACQQKPKPEIIQLSPEYGVILADQIREQVGATIAEGLILDLWAADTLVKDPTAISIDNGGRIFYNRAQRLRNSEFDIRGHRDWMTASISFQSPEDRRKFLRDTFATERSHLNTWLPDLNRDSIHDWRDLTVEKEEVWWIEDGSGDGIADKAQLFIRDFHEEHTDLANGLHAEENEVFLAVGPDLWRLKDKDGDGIADDKESISHGYAVHIGFGAHGMSGVTRGPDGRIWWGIGDIGMNVVDKDGKQWKYPNQGVIVRSEPDGTGFEVFAAGLRNTHEFVFDQYGNLITEDNDGDHPGERERLVYITNGSDGGWRINWQFGKYTDPKNNLYKVWMDERLHVPRWEGQPAYITPPIVNYVNGPTGMVYNPGTALSERWYDHFFIVEFRGTPANSPIHAFTLEPDGASFKLKTTEKIVSGLLPAGLAFGPDGALYFSDWIDGWGTKEKGRIWKLDATDRGNADIRKETQALLAEDFTKKTVMDLGNLLGHQDMRVRLKAQFELADRGENGHKIFTEAASPSSSQLKRIHGLWGIAQLSRKDLKFATPLVQYLTDEDPEIQAQAAKMIGDVNYSQAADGLIPLLMHPSLRVQFFAAEALGRTAHKPGLVPIMRMLEANDDKDAWLRHAGALAMARIGDTQPIVANAGHPSRALRIASVVALRRLQDAGVSVFLNDQDEYIVAETARAIHDDYSIEGGLPALAALLNTTNSKNEVIVRRCISANLRLGQTENFQALVQYALKDKAPSVLRVEALEALSTWEDPSPLDRVDGRFRGYFKREAPIDLISGPIRTLLDHRDDKLVVAAIRVVRDLSLNEEHKLAQLARRGQYASIRSKAIDALAAMNYQDMASVLQSALKDPSTTVRSSALASLPKAQIDDATAVLLLENVLRIGTIEEKQTALQALTHMSSDQSIALLENMLARMGDGRIEKELHLDVIEAATEVGMSSDNSYLQKYYAQFESGKIDPEFVPALFGGNVDRGRNIFFRHEGAQCMRCHTVWEWGGDAGPVLSGVGSRLDKESLLQSLIDPNAEIASGYESIAVYTKQDETFSGIVRTETDTDLTMILGDLSLKTIKKEDIVDRLEAASSMPGVKEILTKKEIRDLVAFLASITESHSSD